VRCTSARTCSGPETTPNPATETKSACSPVCSGQFSVHACPPPPSALCCASRLARYDLIFDLAQRYSSLKIANSCVGSQVHLFVEILNKYLYFFDRKCPAVSGGVCASGESKRWLNVRLFRSPQITVKYLKGLIALVEEHLPQLDNSDVSACPCPACAALP
jgi:hypothetical protein